MASWGGEGAGGPAVPAHFRDAPLGFLANGRCVFHTPGMRVGMSSMSLPAASRSLPSNAGTLLYRGDTGTRDGWCLPANTGGHGKVLDKMPSGLVRNQLVAVPGWAPACGSCGARAAPDGLAGHGRGDCSPAPLPRRKRGLS